MKSVWFSVFAAVLLIVGCSKRPHSDPTLQTEPNPKFKGARIVDITAPSQGFFGKGRSKDPLMALSSYEGKLVIVGKVKKTDKDHRDRPVLEIFDGNEDHFSRVICVFHRQDAEFAKIFTELTLGQTVRVLGTIKDKQHMVAMKMAENDPKVPLNHDLTDFIELKFEATDLLTEEEVAEIRRM